MTTRIVELRRGILKKNDELAAGLREHYGGRRAGAQSGFEPRDGQDRVSRADAARTARARRAGWRRWWAIWRPTTMRAGWQPAARRCARSIRMESATLKRR